MLISIFGGTGFVGHHLIHQLLKAGHQVRLFSRNPAQHKDLGCLPAVELCALRSWQPEPVAAAIQGSQAVINLIGILNERGFNGSGFQAAHVDTTKCLIQACAQAGITRFLQMSSLGAGEGYSHYLKSKGAAESAIMEAAQDGRLQPTIFQPSVIFGRGDSFILRFAQLLKISPILPLARPNARFQPVWVGDVATAFTQALSNNTSINKRYPLVGPEVYSLREIVQYIAALLNLRRLILPLPGFLSHLQAQIMDFVPGKPYSTDNDRSLLTDSISTIDGLAQLGIRAHSMKHIVPTYLAPKSTHQKHLDRLRRQAGRN